MHRGIADTILRYADWIMIIVGVLLILLAVVALFGCAANRVAFSEAHYYPSGLPKSLVELHQIQLTTAGSKLQEGANTFTRLDDQSFESGNTSAGLEAAGDPVEALRVALPVLELLAAPPAAVGPTQPGPSPLVRLLEILRAIGGTGQ